MANRRISGRFATGEIGKSSVVHTASGIGMANAAGATVELILRFKPSVLIIFGIGGAYPGSGLNLGDLALATSEIYADLGVAGKAGFKGLKALGFGVLTKGPETFYNEIPLAPALVRRSNRLFPGIVSGPFATVNQATGTTKKARELRRRYKAVCENMEGAAAAHMALAHGVRALEIRGISNIVEDRDLKKWDRDSAAQRVQEAVVELCRFSRLNGF